MFVDWEYNGELGNNVSLKSPTLLYVLYSIGDSEQASDFGHSWCFSTSPNRHDVITPEELEDLQYVVPELVTRNLSACVALQNDKSTPLHLACTQGAFEVVKMMLSYSLVEDVINLTDGAHQTPLHRSAYQLVAVAAS